ncbi:PEGA domain-containing protein [Candidatus Parcubacteria bacterium]|nr:MAG: PEGA domain-containing protein [Candidatus Parcubacteria bacterium]
MKLFWRRSIYIAFFGIFFILAPFLVISSSGFRLNLKKMRLEKIGILVFETKPKEANIYIDGKKIADKTPAQFNNFFPGNYNVIIEKPGYYPWNKTLTVKSQETTFAKGIILFKKSLPVLKIESLTDNLKYIGNKQSIIYVNKNNELEIYNLSSKQTKTVLELQKDESADLKNSIISPEGNKLALEIGFHNTISLAVIDLNSGNIIKLQKITGSDLTRLKWDLNNENLIYGITDQSLYRIDLTSQTAEKILAKPLKDYLINGFNIYYITENNFLVQQRLYDKTLNEIKLPPDSDYFLSELKNGLLILHDSKNSDLMALDEDAFFEPQKIDQNILLQIKADKTSLNDDKTDLLYYTDFELAIYDFKSKKEYLLTRLSEEIDNAFWFSDNKYVLYESGGKIKIIELDSKDRRIDITLATADEIFVSFFNPVDNKIYFTGKIGHQIGLFELETI